MTNTCCLICCKKLHSLFTINPANVQDLSSTVCQLLDLSLSSTASVYTGYFTTPSLCFSCHQKILLVQKLYDEIDEIKARIDEFKSEIGDGLIKGTCSEFDRDAELIVCQEKRTRIAQEVKRSRSRLIGGPTSTSTQTDSENAFELVFNLDGFEILSDGAATNTKEVTSKPSSPPPEKSDLTQIEGGYSYNGPSIPLCNIDDLSSSSTVEVESCIPYTKPIWDFNINLSPEKPNFGSLPSSSTPDDNENEKEQIGDFSHLISSDVNDLSSLSSAPEFESFKSNTNSNLNLNFNLNLNPNSNSNNNTAIPSSSEPCDTFDDDDDDEYFQAPDINIDELDSILEDQRQEQNQSQDQDLVQESNSSSSYSPVVNENEDEVTYTYTYKLDDNIVEPEKSFDDFSEYVNTSPNNTENEKKDYFEVIISTEELNSKKTLITDRTAEDVHLAVDEPNSDKSAIEKKFLEWMKLHYNEDINKSASLPGGLNRKLRSEFYLQLGIFVCNFCKEQMPSEEALLEHLARVHEPEKEKKYKCPYPRCDKTFTTHLVFQRHQTIHTNIGNNFCPVCNNGTNFEDTYSLYTHIKRLHFPHLKRNRDKRNNLSTKITSD